MEKNTSQEKCFVPKKKVCIDYAVPFISEQNRVSERMNRTLLEKARAMIFENGQGEKQFCQRRAISIVVQQMMLRKHLWKCG